MKNIKRVEIKNVKHYPSLSQETDCFEAIVFLDGKLLGKVVNHGTGGCHEYAMTGDKQKLLEEYARTLPRYKWSDGTSMLRVVDGKSETVEWSHQDADDVINTLFGEWLTKTTLSKELRKGIILTEKGLENGTYELYSFRKYPRLKDNPLLIEKAKWFDSNKYEIVNVLPIEKQIKWWETDAPQGCFGHRVYEQK